MVFNNSICGVKVLLIGYVGANCKACTGVPERRCRECKLLYQCAGSDGVVERRKVGVLADPRHQAQQKLKSSPVGRRQHEAADLKSLSGHALLLEQT